MPADHTLPETSARHSNAADPYPCHKRAVPPGAAWAVDYGYCRHSLDELSGEHDPRCPKDCQHKAPATVVKRFTKLFIWRGAMAASQYACEQRETRNG